LSIKAIKEMEKGEDDVIVCKNVAFKVITRHLPPVDMHVTFTLEPSL
jgi:hypothetical protein